MHRIRWIFGVPAWIVTRYDDAVTVLRDPRFSKVYVANLPAVPRPIRDLTRNLLNLDAPDHTRLRALVNKAFTTRVVEQLRGRAERLCQDLLDRAARRGEMDLVADYALPVPLTIIAELLGIPEAERVRFGKWSKQVASGDSGRAMDILRAWISMFRFRSYFRELVKRRRADPREDLVTALIETEEEGDKLTEAELIAMLGLLLFAGYETTVNLISSGALALMQHPQQRERLVTEPEQVEPAVEELLRFTSPADFATPRVTREEVTLSGTVIPRKALVLAALGSANRDESKFDQPDTLNLSREPNKHIAFGLGAHFCVGAPLARLEAQIALPALFRRFPALRTKDGPLRWRSGLIFRGLERLPVLLQ